MKLLYSKDYLKNGVINVLVRMIMIKQIICFRRGMFSDCLIRNVSQLRSTLIHVCALVQKLVRKTLADIIDLSTSACR